LARRRRKSVLHRLLIRAALTVYRWAVIVSALIVVAYGLFHLFVRPPQVDNPGEVSRVEAGVSVDLTGGVSVVPEQQEPQEPEPEQGPVRREQVYTFLLVGTDDGNGNADTLMVASYDVLNQKVGVVSIPRDTIVDRSWSKYPKINGGYSRGIETVRQELSHMLGIPIDYYIRVDIQGFVALVDEVGGVDFDVPVNMDYDDPEQDLAIHFEKGMQHLTGQQALEVVRFRHNNDMSGYSDVGRTQTQQKLLTAVGKKVLSWNNLGRVKAFADIFIDYVDTDLKAGELAWLASQALYLDLADGLSTKTLVGRGDAVYRGYTWCYELDEQQALADINALLNPYTTPVTADMAHIVKGDSYIT
jgi:LCP family protein required for cell wall assembly